MSWDRSSSTRGLSPREGIMMVSVKPTHTNRGDYNKNHKGTGG